MYKALQQLKANLSSSAQNLPSSDYVNIYEILLQCTNHVFTFT